MENSSTACLLGATMEFAIKEIQSEPYERDRVGARIRVAPNKAPLTELEAGSLFAWPAGAPGTADWKFKHLAGFNTPGDGMREVLVVRTMQVVEEYQLKAPYRCISVPSIDTLPVSTATRMHASSADMVWTKAGAP